MKRAYAWFRCWWHCLVHFHRMAHLEVRFHGSRRFITTRIFCGDCGQVFYGAK